MYVRPQQSTPSRIKLPENYGGSTFGSSYYNDMPPPVRQSPPPSNTPAKASPLTSELHKTAFSDLPPISEPVLISQLQQTHAQIDGESSATDAPAREPDGKADESRGSSIFSSLIPKSSMSKNFPFGHGIGTEELLILGMMMLIYFSGSEEGDIDGEFIILLGLLLFAG